jgi:hypothetical protein
MYQITFLPGGKMITKIWMRLPHHLSTIGRWLLRSSSMLYGQSSFFFSRGMESAPFLTALPLLPVHLFCFRST